MKSPRELISKVGVVKLAEIRLTLALSEAPDMERQYA